MTDYPFEEIEQKEFNLKFSFEMLTSTIMFIQKVQSLYPDENNPVNKNCTNLLTIPASANRNMINSIMNFYKNAFPAIALTKLDESHVSAEELSIFAELNSKIGILSGSRSIIGSIAFAKSEVLAQYMKDISV